MWAIGSRAVEARMRRWERSVRRNGSAGRLTDLALLAFMLAMLAEMEIEAGEETIPYHLLFLSLTIVYGFRVWPLVPTAVVLLAVTVSTGLIMYNHYQRDLIDGPTPAHLIEAPTAVVRRRRTRSRRWPTGRRPCSIGNATSSGRPRTPSVRR